MRRKALVLAPSIIRGKRCDACGTSASRASGMWRAITSPSPPLHTDRRHCLRGHCDAAPMFVLGWRRLVAAPNAWRSLCEALRIELFDRSCLMRLMPALCWMRVAVPTNVLLALGPGRPCQTRSGRQKLRISSARFACATPGPRRWAVVARHRNRGCHPLVPREGAGPHHVWRRANDQGRWAEL